MSRTIHEALQSDNPKAAIEQLLSRGGLYHKGADIAHEVVRKIEEAEPYYPPIFPKDDEGALAGFLDVFGVERPEDLPQSKLLSPYIGAVMLVEITNTSQLRPHELAAVGIKLPATRIVFNQHGQESTVY